MVIFVLFALAMLAGWGLDELPRASAPERAPDARVLGSGAVILACRSCGSWPSGDLALSRFVGRAERGLGLRRPARAGGRDPRECSRRRPRWSAIDHRDRPASARCCNGSRSRGGAGGHRAQPRGAPPARPMLPVAAAVAIACTVLAADLFRANMGFNPAIPVAHAEQPETGALRYLESRAPSRFAGLDRRRHRPAAAAQPGDALRALRRARLRLSGRAALRRVLARHRRAAGRARATHRPGGAHRALAPRAEPAERERRDAGPGRPAVPAARPERGVRRAPTRASTATRARCPRAFLVGGQRVAADADAALAATIAPGSTRGARRSPRSRFRGCPTGDRGRRAPRALAAYGEDRVSVETSGRSREPAGADRRALPGLEGDRRRASRAASSAWTTCCAASWYPPGTHRVEFAYEPASWRIGWIVSLVALLGLIAGRRSASRAGAGRGSRRARRAAGACCALRRRPALAAALLYAGRRDRVRRPGAASRAGRCRTRTCCGSSRPGSGVKPAGLERPGNPELGDAPRHVQLFLAADRATQLPHVPLWNPYIIGRAAVPGQLAVGGLLALQPPRRTCCRSGRRSAGSRVLKLWVAAFGTFLLAARSACASRGALLAGLVFAFNL